MAFKELAQRHLASEFRTFLELFRSLHIPIRPLEMETSRRRMRLILREAFAPTVEARAFLLASCGALVYAPFASSPLGIPLVCPICQSVPCRSLRRSKPRDYAAGLCGLRPWGCIAWSSVSLDGLLLLHTSFEHLRAGTRTWNQNTSRQNL